MLENIATGEHIGFDDLADLSAFLELQIAVTTKSTKNTKIVSFSVAFVSFLVSFVDKNCDGGNDDV